MDWYYAKGGLQAGPISEQEFMALTKSGEIGPETFVWQPQMENWKRAREVPGIFGSAPAPTAPYTGPYTPTGFVAPVALAGEGLGNAVTGLLIAGGALDVISFLVSLASGADSTDAAFVSWMGLLQLLLYWTTAGVFAAWAYRAHRNLRLFGVQQLDYTPAWAAGGFFVPFLNLVRPYQVFREIWKASDPMTTPDHWKNSSSSPLLVVWWIAFLTMGVLGQLAFRLAGTLNTEELFSLFLLSDVVSMAATVLAILVVRQIIARQRAKAANALAARSV